MTQRSVLEAVGVRKSYGVGTETETEILHGIDLVLGAAEIVALTGPSGAGKSTFLNVMGLLERPTSGRIRINGEDAADLDEAGLTRLRGRSIGFIFQFHHLMPAFTALENVMMPLLVDRGRPDGEMRSRAAELLRKVGLGALLGRRPGKLSGGQQQRVAVARALAMSPPLVLADEPTGNLDTASADEVFSLLRAFNRDFGVTFLVVTHDPRLARRCDRVLELVDGRLVGEQKGSDLPSAC
ncbi:MAG: ABC transporter ATP-binding protein [Candidatus Methylomirabilia bacterium]